MFLYLPFLFSFMLSSAFLTAIVSESSVCKRIIKTKSFYHCCVFHCLVFVKESSTPRPFSLKAPARLSATCCLPDLSAPGPSATGTVNYGRITPDGLRDSAALSRPAPASPVPTVMKLPGCHLMTGQPSFQKFG